MTLLAKPSRSYANVDHDPDGLSGIGSGAYGSSSTSTSKKLLKKDTNKVEGGFKTYRPPLAETHLRRPLGYDPHPESHFAPLPPAFHLGGKHKKDAALAGQRAELEHILQPEYKSTYNYDMEGDSSSVAGPSRNHSSRTAGGLGMDRKGKTPLSVGLRPSASISSFHQSNGNGGVGNGEGPRNGAGRKSGGLGGGVYVDSNGKLHDTEFDPFGHISEMSRAKSRRRSAFGSDRRKKDGGSSTSSSESGSDVGFEAKTNLPRRSTDTGREREEEEIKKRLEMERKRLDDVSGYAAARRRSMMSERSGGGGIRPSTPSIRSNEDGQTGYGFNGNSIYTSSLAPTAMTGRSKSQHGHYIPSPLSPTFSTNTPSIYSSAQSRSAHTPQTATTEGKVQGTPPEKTTESTAPPPKKETKSKVEYTKDGSKKITGFDAPISPVPPYTPTVPDQHQHLLPRAPSVNGGRLSPAPGSGVGRGSIDTTRGERERPPKPVERPREELFPETPAQIKRREERERRIGSTVTTNHTRLNRPNNHPHTGLSVDTIIASDLKGKSRILPEIEIVEDDDPRIIFPTEGKTTKIQSKHDHVIRGPFSHALNALGSSQQIHGNGNGNGSDLGDYSRRGSTSKSIGGGSLNGSGKPSSTLMEEDGGYLPSRWASGDKALRKTEIDREKYRPMEWKSGGGAEIITRNDEWHPSTKDHLKRNMKDIATSARFSLFRTKKKLLRKAEM
ncbi:uncharacterized protein I206_102454 [Kwoniella pini CBS 10737]|uniref:Uncharacterized protein n=1 Tax=Kwoniella pini CBS 10737 TaxID=1296096 RepID=A0A1B9I5F0_9TREE|nr:uncharacterized protein I206_02804 [Kwoniella pini CBS 10737]OCF50748.1 hypothetical protein I206_02804 [Kwoniella pini CBS 10737]